MSSDMASTGELLFSSSLRMGLEPKWITEFLLSISTPSGEQHIYYTKSLLNSHIGVHLSSNKFLARTLMETHGLPNIPFSKPSSSSEAQAFLEEHGQVIAKPLRGIGARDINLINCAEEMSDLKFGNYIFEKYITGRELRYLILNGDVIAVHESDYGTSLDAHRPLKRISYEESRWDQELVQITKTVAKLMGLRFAAVDFIVHSSGRTYILEVNCTPGLKWFHSPTSGPAVDVATMFLQTILDDASLPTKPVADLELSVA